MGYRAEHTVRMTTRAAVGPAGTAGPILADDGQLNSSDGGLPDARLRQSSRRKLQESLGQLQDEVRRHPADSKQRIFLFQLLSVMGQWDRAMTQLGVLAEMDDSALAMVQTYREVLQCESLRREVFEGRRTPVVIGEPEQWVALLIEALRLGGRVVRKSRRRSARGL